MRCPEVDWVARWAHYTPGRLCLRDHDDGREWTYLQTERRAAALAAHLHAARGVGRGDRVGVLARNTSEHVFLFLACVKLGAILVPLNFRLTAHELATPLRDAAPVVVFHDAEHAGRLAGSGVQAAELEEVSEIVAPGRAPASTPGRGDGILSPDRSGALEDVVMILYTAGSTGQPKGAMITHRMLLWNAVNTELRLDITSADHTLGFAPFFHTGGWNVLLTPFLHHGASHTLLKGFDPDLILELIAGERVTILFGVPTMLQMLADAPGFGAADLSSVRYAIVGGAPMPLPLIDTWHGRGVFVRQGYGLTEVGPNCFSLHQDHAVSHRGSIGFPNFYVQARVVGDEGRDCAADEVGELWLKSEVVTPGYWRDEAATRAALVDGWFRTGDLVHRDADGFFYVVDRQKNMIISGGENVYPAEVERCLLEHPAVREAAVIGVPHARWGEAGHAFLVLEPGRTVDPVALREHCRSRLAGYKIPRHITFTSGLPLNDAGKLDRLALRRLADSGPGGAAAAPATRSNPPQGDDGS
ncbi:MAG: AMP-binding protein [Candidatus Krumholzibacteriia bacterium]